MRRYLVAGDPSSVRPRLVAAIERHRVPAGSISQVDAEQVIDALCDDSDDLWLVSAPFAAHLFAAWLARSLPGEWRALAPAGAAPPVAFARPLHEDWWISVAEWRCPAHCIEPAVCPATRQPKTWRIEEAIAEWRVAFGSSGGVEIALSRVRHLGGGVMAAAVDEWRAECRRLMPAVQHEGARVLSATVSACHGRVTALERLASGPACP